MSQRSKLILTLARHNGIDEWMSLSSADTRPGLVNEQGDSLNVTPDELMENRNMFSAENIPKSIDIPCNTLTLSRIAGEGVSPIVKETEGNHCMDNQSDPYPSTVTSSDLAVTTTGLLDAQFHSILKETEGTHCVQTNSENYMEPTKQPENENEHFEADTENIDPFDRNDNDQILLQQSDEESESSVESTRPFSSDDSIADPNFSPQRRVEAKNLLHESQTANEQIKQTRKRKANPDSWLKNVAIRARNSGKPYVSSSKTKKQFESRKLAAPCDSQRCRLQCSSKISETDRESIFSDYWSLGNLQRQRDFLLACIETVTPKYRYTREGSERRMNNAFYFIVRNTKYRVCKLFFKSTLGISDRPIRTIVEKKTLFTGGMITDDRRGKHGMHFRVDEAIKNSVRRHIESIPRIESHYCRGKSSREYIDGGKSLSQIHRDYVDVCIEKGEPYANYLMFSRIFNYQYNIPFFSPKKDQCEDCMVFQVASDQERILLREDYENHLKEKELCRREKEYDKNNSDECTVVVVYDLQAVLQCPKGDVSTFYYTSKLNVFNFTMYEMKTRAAKCFVWDESEANRGVCEIGSCVLRYIQSLGEKFSTAQLNLIFYSDNCCGQQKNRFMFSMYLYAVQQFPYINSITHKFLIKGHTQNEGDSVHSVIERSIKRSVKSGPIIVPQQYVTLIRTAKKSGEPYAVEELDYESFVDLKDLGTKMQLNALKNENNETVPVGDIKIIRCDKENPNQVHYKTSYSQKNFNTILIKPSRRPKSTNVSLKRLYNTKPGFNTKKKESILSLFKKKKPPISKSYFPYFNSL